MSGVKQSSGCFAVLGCLEMPAWNGLAGSACGEPGGAAAMGGVGLGWFGVLGISHCPLELVFTEFCFPSFGTW